GRLAVPAHRRAPRLAGSHRRLHGGAGRRGRRRQRPDHPGSQQALDLVAKALVDPGDRVLMEAPGYLGAIGAAQNYEAELYDVPVGAGGIDLDRLADAPKGAKYLYTVS